MSGNITLHTAQSQVTWARLGAAVESLPPSKFKVLYDVEHVPGIGCDGLLAIPWLLRKVASCRVVSLYGIC